MKRIAIAVTLATTLFAGLPAQAQEQEQQGQEDQGSLFTGDVRLACEAVLCLSSGTRPSECAPSLARYFSITAKKLSDTITKRKNFLELCPAATQDAKMIALVDAITHGAGRCDYAALNSSLRVWSGQDGKTYIRNTLPSYCSAYLGNEYTDITAPRYVGVPERGGFWVEAGKYDAALKEYNARIKAEDQAAGRRWN